MLTCQKELNHGHGAYKNKNASALGCVKTLVLTQPRAGHWISWTLDLISDYFQYQTVL